MLHADGEAVDPAPLGGCLDHRVLAGHVVGGQGHVDLGSGPGDDVEVGERRLHHHDVGPFAEVEADLLEGLAGVGGILLVALAVAAAGDGDVDRVAERAVERRGVLGGVGHDRHLLEAVVVEGLADGHHGAVHHPGGGDDVGARRGLGQCDLAVELEGGVVVDLAVVGEQPAVAVRGVLVEAEVGHQHDLVAEGVAQLAQRHLHDAVGVPRTRAPLVLRRGDAEEDDPGDAQLDQRGDLGGERRQRVLHHARDGRDGLGLGDALTDEERGDQVVDREPGLGDQSTKGRRAAQSAQSALGEAHRRSAYARPRRRPPLRVGASGGGPATWAVIASTRPGMVWTSATTSTRSPC